MLIPMRIQKEEGNGSTLEYNRLCGHFDAQNMDINHHETANERVLHSVPQAPQKSRTPVVVSTSAHARGTPEKEGIPKGPRHQHFGVRIS